MEGVPKLIEFLYIKKKMKAKFSPFELIMWCQFFQMYLQD